jgi:pyruvate/2-oxoglutarate dehydrogenase complex dihydrolipoamide acyltransferase (E2) component
VTLSVSQPVRIAAICGLVFTVLVFGGLRTLGGTGDSASSDESSLEAQIAQLSKRAKPKAPAAAKPATPAPAAHKAATPTAKKPAVKPKPVPRPTVDLKAIAAARAAGLPEPLAQAFGRHGTVVVSLYDPYSQVDGTSFAEAKAGAALAGVGFVPLSVLSQRDVGKLTEQLGVLPDPGVLVYVRPSRLTVKIAGFADKETVAQAAENAAHGA